MKRLFLFMFISAFILSSCGNDTKVKDVKKNEDGTTTTTTTTYDADNLKKMAETGDEMTKKMEDLKKLTPLTLDQLKALLPAELNGIKRTDYQANSTMGYAMVNGEYRKDDNTELKVMIYDCAGEAGAGMYGLTYMGMMNFQQESEKEYTKSIEFKGGKAIEKYNKENKQSSLTYVSNNRLLIVMEGRNMEPSELKSAADNLAISL
jgi:uncharacterized lipoprotein YehR (DUF1307 family)